MTFHIGSQHGGVVNNVGGDQHVHGDQRGQLVSDAEARRAVQDLMAAVRAAPLDSRSRQAAASALDDVAAELAQDAPDRSRVAEVLSRVTRVLGAAGPVVSAAAGVVGPLGTLVTWLGGQGAGLGRLVAGLLG